MNATAQTLRQKLHQLADDLSPGATWEEVRHQVEFRASVERGLADSQAGRTIAHEDLLKEFGISE